MDNDVDTGTDDDTGVSTDPLARLARDVFATGENEIQCEQAGDLMVLSSGANLSDAESQQQYPALWQHFQFCRDCAQEYRMLAELTGMEATGDLPRPARIPRPPTRDDGSWLQRLQARIDVLFDGFGAVVPSLARGESLGVEPVEVELADGEIIVELDVEAAEEDPTLRALYCHVAGETTAHQTALEGVSLWLQEEESQAVVQEQTLDDLGDALFVSIPQGVYTLRVRIPGQEYAIIGIALP